jgi:protein-L-isoaspartate(D-aspartate) O-methyltransferase
MQGMMRLYPAVILAALAACAQDAYQAKRERMIHEQIELRSVRNPKVLQAMRSTPRHLFVPEPLRSQAYEDYPLPIGHGQTISQPYIVALMTELLDPQPGQKVLEVGTGSGYQAAVLSPLVGQVLSIEIIPELAKSSAELLKKLGYKNVVVREGDGYLGWPEEAPFDRIILTAAPPNIPEALIRQLKAGGKLVAPVGESPFGQELVVVDKTADGKLRRRSIIPVRFVPMVRGR